MKPGRTEGVFSGKPSRRKDDKVNGVNAGRVTWRVQHQENRRVWMVEADGADRVEKPQVVLVRRIVSVPCDHVERRMTNICAPQMPVKFCHEFKIALTDFI